MRFKCDRNTLPPLPAVSDLAKSRGKYWFHALRKTRAKKRQGPAARQLSAAPLDDSCFLHLLSEVQNRLSSQDCCEWQIRMWI